MDELASERARLERELRAFSPADDAEARHRNEILALVSSSPACFSRHHYDPGHVTGSAFVLCRRTGRLLLHHHRRLERWLQLGGHDDGEHDPAATALREAREESGLSDLVPAHRAILDLDVHAIPAARGEPGHLHHDVRYAFFTDRPDAARRDDAESRDLAWLTLEDAAARLGEPGAARALRKLARLVPSSA